MKIIYPDGTTDVFKPKGDKPTLEELQGIVGGDIEIIYLPGIEVLVVDEEGRRKKKPFNEEATRLYDGGRSILGVALLCNFNDIE